MNITGLQYCHLQTPIGELRLVSSGDALHRIEFEGQHRCDGEPGDNAILRKTRKQLQEYFSGQRREFSLALDPGGTVFQRSVWQRLQAIPFGELRSYAEIAGEIDNRKAVRAVGAANGANPLPIVVPCHRVIGSNGKLTGFAGGLETKAALLELEGIRMASQGQLFASGAAGQE